MIESCRRCGEDVRVVPSSKGTRMALSLEMEPGGTVELVRSQIVGGGLIATRVGHAPGVARYLEHAKVCRSKKRRSR